jgi:peptidoglycan/LPS O-acetylase OafA/YrhL
MSLFHHVLKIWNFRKPIGEVYNPGNNGFDLLRFIWASLVIVFHSYALLGSSDVDFFTKFVKGQSNLGEFAVGGFFVISGFLLVQSLQHSTSLLSYFWKRFLRLFPALLISLIFSTLILGPFITSQSLREYFIGNDGISPFKFIFLNLTLNVFGYMYIVRDLFIHNPNVAVNGSLWTLKHEFACYLLLAFLSLLGFVKKSKLFLGFTLFIGGAYLANELMNARLISTEWWIFNEVEYPYFLKLLWLFLSGSIIYIYRDRIYVSTKIILLFISLLLLSINLRYFYYAWYLLIPYVIISISTLLPLSGFSKYGDFSYGIYVYAFPIQQALVFAFLPSLNEVSLMLYSFLCTLPVAIISWHLVEKPALSLKKILK